MSETVNPQFLIQKGNVCAFRIFDLGSEINLKKAAQILEKHKTLAPFGLKKTTRSILIAERPLVVSLEPWGELIGRDQFEVRSVAKLWSFGALSLQLELTLTRDYSIDDLFEVGHFLENNENFHARVEAQARQLMFILAPSIEKPAFWDQYEDYLVFNFKKTTATDRESVKTLLTDKVSALIMGEKAGISVKHSFKDMEESTFQYSSSDLTILHWNGAVIYDIDDADDIMLTLEFALCSLFELRYYDELLDKQLAALYQQIGEKRTRVFANPYKRLSKKASLQYIEISEIVDRISNAFKVLGDYYYATIFRAAIRKFYVNDWKRSVNSKLNHLAEVSKLFQTEIDERRNQLMEMIIILLITFEVIPFLVELMMRR
ncbi:MAG: hypothetical protein HYW48_11515 [Deltaproteobacteria bacterium]|nr:hypothetical protein [Deltaproteobacteria bacterium]